MGSILRKIVRQEKQEEYDRKLIKQREFDTAMGVFNNDMTRWEKIQWNKFLDFCEEVSKGKVEH